MVSNLFALRPGGRLLPIGFQSGSKSKIARTVAAIDAMIPAKWRDVDVPARVPTSTLHGIIANIAETIDSENTN
jgi:hypothetical protein